MGEANENANLIFSVIVELQKVDDSTRYIQRLLAALENVAKRLSSSACPKPILDNQDYLEKLD